MQTCSFYRPAWKLSTNKLGLPKVKETEKSPPPGDIISTHTDDIIYNGETTPMHKLSIVTTGVNKCAC